MRWGRGKSISVYSSSSTHTEKGPDHAIVGRDLREESRKCSCTPWGWRKPTSSPPRRLQGDLGAESIDFLDIIFRLEVEFRIKINQDELFPQSFLLDDSAFINDGRLTDEGLAALHQQMPYADWRKFERDRHLERIDDLFTVDLVTSFVGSKLMGSGAAEADAHAPARRQSDETLSPLAISAGGLAAFVEGRSSAIA